MTDNRGRPKQDREHQFALWLNEADYQTLKQTALATERTMAATVRLALRQFSKEALEDAPDRAGDS